MEVQDAIVVGAGPAGLTAAVYLGRYRRRCLILEDDESRARWIPTSHNIPGFTAGIGGKQFLNSLKAQALRYGAHIRRCHVTRLSFDDQLFCLEAGDVTYRGRYLLLATGVRDHPLAIPGASEALMRSLLRVCPICDAYEAIDQRIAVIGDGAFAEREARFLRTYSDRITLLNIGAPNGSPAAHGIAAQSIERLTIQLSDLRIKEDRVVLSSAGEDRQFDVVYLALGCSSKHDLALSLGARCDERGALTVNAHQETSVARLYAAGDLVRGLNQVIVAAAESAIAATDIHNKLREAVGVSRR